MCCFGLLIHHRWEHEEKRDSKAESDSPLSIFQSRDDERTGSVEEARQGCRGDREGEKKQREREMRRRREMNERGGRQREGWRCRGMRGDGNSSVADRTPALLSG